ncbi:MAG: iron-sulfur cluster assembly scaffold protein [Campylobacterota bacterium]|nr:iron-sulfur cluster assembly scaffold protein [Campylobacterota bacterium]
MAQQLKDEHPMMATFIDHMGNPRNYGKLDDFDGVGIGENPDNGERVIIYFKLDESKLIAQIMFHVQACSTTLVSGSMFTETIKGVDIPEAKVLTGIMMEKLEELAPEEAACSEIVAMAFLAALEQYESGQNDPDAVIPVKQITQVCKAEADA